MGAVSFWVVQAHREGHKEEHLQWSASASFNSLDARLGTLRDIMKMKL